MLDHLPVTVLSGFLVPESLAKNPQTLPDYPDTFPIWRRQEAEI